MGAGAFLTACAGHSGTPGSVAADVARGTSASVSVVNAYGAPLTIYAIGSGVIERLGTVNQGSNSRWILPAAVLGEGTIELMAQADNGQPLIRFGPMRLSPGRVVDFTIVRDLALSSATVRP
jgi:hypothetical protein